MNTLEKAMRTLVLHHPFYADMVMSSPLVERSDIPTMATDGRSIYYNPEFIRNELKDRVDWTVFVFCHEVEHIVRLHCLRCGSRDPFWWNIAADHRINLDLLAAGLKGPVDERGRFMGVADHKYLDDSKWSAEAIYQDVGQDEQEQPGGQGQGGQQSDDSDGQEGSGQGAGQKQGQGPGKTKAGAKNVFDGDMLEPKNPDGSDLSAGQRDELDREVRGKILTAVAQAIAKDRKKGRGNIPAHLRGMIDELTQPKVDWRHELREFVRATKGSDTTWNSLNRRVRHRGLKLPGPYSEQVGGLGIILDTSGSCHAAIGPFLSEVIGIADQVQPERIVVLFVDTNIQAEVITTADDFEADMGDLMRRPPFGGGTDLRPAFRRIEELGDFDAVVCLTDLYTPWPDSFEFAEQTLFVDTEQHTQQPEPFGRKVQYTDDD